MENMTSADLAQLLYVAYYGRPADEAGQQFWAARIDEVGVEGIAADFGNSTEFDTEFGDMGSVALINNLYDQLFGREAEAEGLQYWLDVLADGTPLASIAYAIAEGAQGGDATGLQNKVTLSNQFTAAVAAGDVTYEGVEAVAYGREFLASINENTNVETYDVQAVVNGLESGELPVDTSDLRQGLQDLREAEEAVETFLVNALENEAVATEVGDPDATTAEAADIGAALDTTRDALAVELGEVPADFEAAGASTKAGIIADERALRETAIETAQTNLDEANAAIDEVEGLRSAVTNYSTALAAEAEATTAFETEQAGTDGALVTFANRNATVDLVDITYLDNADPQVGAAREDAYEVLIDGTVVLRFNSETDQYEVVGEPDFAGFETFQAALQSERDAAIALEDAQTDTINAADAVDTILDGLDADEEAAITDNTELEVGDLADAAALNTAFTDLQTSVTDAEELLQDLNDAVVAWEAAVALSTELEQLTTAVSDAEDYIEDTEEDGGLGFNLVDGDFTGALASTADSDVFLFADDEGATVTVGDFGDEGIDRIFFGPDYSLVQLAEGEEITDRVGSASELEIFWNQTDTGLQLYVEASAEAGRDLGTDAITQITLTGVNAEDISFTSGFLSAGTATEIA
nr:DUF4214 domain-containing protein [uncultured Halomonas sp.]